MSNDVLVVSRQGRLAELWNSSLWRVVIYLAANVALGALCGLMWSLITDRPSYRISTSLNATISERAQTDIIGADVVFTFVTGFAGLLIGVVGWFVWHRKGWLVTTIPLIGAFIASFTAWRMGLALSGSGFSERLATAGVGDVVPVDLELRALSALLVAPFAAVIPIMLMAAFWPDPADGQRRETVRVED